MKITIPFRNMKVNQLGTVTKTIPFKTVKNKIKHLAINVEIMTLS